MSTLDYLAGIFARWLNNDGKLPADNVPYDNTSSGLTATTAQDALDELASGATGEANTISSVGSGASFVWGKSGVDLRIRSAVAGSGIGIAASANEVTFTWNGSAQNLGTGEGVFASKSGATLQMKSIKAGSGVRVTSNANEINVQTTFVQASDPGAVGAGVLWFDT